MNTAALRESLGLTQVQFAQLLGVHSLTVSKWERGVLQPTPWQWALLDAFARIPARHRAASGAHAARLFADKGAAVALFHLLQAAFDKEKL